LGNFDGLHLGHKKLINSLLAKARENDGLAAAFIFDPHPDHVLSPGTAPKMLTTAEQKAKMLNDTGMGLLIYNTFNKEIARLSPEEFVNEFLVKCLKVKEVFIGFNYSFGYKGAGNSGIMKELGARCGFGVNVIPPVRTGEEIVSSTLIRQALDRGDIERAEQMLGYYPALSGVVSEGEGRGRAIGFPTANLLIDDRMNIPAVGVYAAQAVMETEKHQAVVNIGQKPTFHEQYPVTVEAHIIDYNKDLYGTALEIILFKKIRDEKKFSGVDELVAQIKADRNSAIDFFKSLESAG
jgi:riboflavin kinase/FMN adenylyltransferase